MRDRKKSLMKKIAILFALLWSASAGAVPNTINFTGRLSTSTGPVNRAVNLTLKIYDVASGGTALWTEIHNNVGADNGLVFVDAGTLTTLDETVLDGRRLYFEIVVDNETLAPRLAINSVPYAVRTEVATNANFLGASIGPGDVVTSINGSGGVAATKTGNAVAVSLSTTGCTSGQAFKYNGTTFACANDLNTTYTGGAGVSVAGTTISLSTTGCAAGSVWKYNGTTFACASDADTTYTAGTGIGINGTSISINTTVVPQLAAANTFSGTNNFQSASNSFTGSGAGLTSLNANNVSTGTLPPARVSGAYTSITSVGTLGSLNVTGEISRDSTGVANIVPIAYGNVSATGLINVTGSTTNFTVTKPSTGRYDIAITGENYFFTNYVTVVSIISGCGIASTSSAGGHLLVFTFSCSGVATDEIFQFATYKP